MHTLNTLSMVLVMITEMQSDPQALSHVSGYMFADTEVKQCTVCYRVAADKASGKCCVQHLAER